MCISYETNKNDDGYNEKCQYDDFNTTAELFNKAICKYHFWSIAYNLKERVFGDVSKKESS